MISPATSPKLCQASANSERLLILHHSQTRQQQTQSWVWCPPRIEGPCCSVVRYGCDCAWVKVQITDLIRVCTASNREPNRFSQIVFLYNETGCAFFPFSWIDVHPVFQRPIRWVSLRPKPTLNLRRIFSKFSPIAHRCNCWLLDFWGICSVPRGYLWVTSCVVQLGYWQLGIRASIPSRGEGRADLIFQNSKDAQPHAWKWWGMRRDLNRG